MDAVEAGGGGGGGACEGTVPGLDERPDQQEERVQEALQLVSAVTAHLRRRLGAMELKMESTHGEASAAADALRGQVARMERLEDKMAAVERRLRGATGLRGESDDVDKMAAAERRLRRTNDLHCESDDANKMAVVERYLRRHTSLHGESDDDDDDKIAAIQRCLRRATNLHYECDVDEKIAAVQRCLPTATDHHGSSDGDDDDKMAPIQRCLPTATDHHGSSDGDDDDKMAAAERRLRSATGLVGYSDDDDDSSRLSVVPSDVDEYPACPGCGTSSSCSALSMTSLASSFAPDDVLAPDAPLLDSIVQIASLLPAENIPPAGTFSKHHRFGIRLDSTHLSSTAAVDAPMSKEARLDSTVQAAPDVPMKRTSATRSTFSCRLCGVSCDSSASSNSAIAFPNQKTSRVDSSIQTVTSVFEKRVHSARSSFSRLCGPILDFSSASFTAGISSPSQDASGLGVTAQTAPLATNEHSSAAPTLLPRRLCERLFDSLSIPATTDADLRYQEARSLDSTAQTQQVSEEHTGTSLTRRFDSQLSDSLGSTTAPPSTSFPNVPRLHPNAQLSLVSNKCLSSNCSISSDLCSLLPSSASVASFETPKASLANVATQISEKHMPPIDTSLSQGLYKVLRSAAALAERSFLPSEEPISRLTAGTHIRANTDERLPLPRKESQPDVPTTSPPVCDVAPSSTTCVCPDVVGCPKQACTQTEDVLWSCGGCSLQAPSSGLLTTSGYVASQVEELRLSQPLSRRSSSVVCQCPSTAGERKSASGCGYALDKVSRSTSCATFSNTNIASSSGFYDCEDNSQSSSISGYDEQSQCSSFHPYSERVTQHVVWMSSPYNPSLYYCVPLINSSFCSISCNEEASDMSAVASDSPWSVSSPQSCFPLCDVARPVTNKSKFSSGLRAISYAPQPCTTPPSTVTNCCSAGVLKSVPEATCTEPSTNTSDVPIFSEPMSSSSAVNVLISDNPQSVMETSDCLIPLPRPSSPKPLAGEGPPEEIRHSSSGVLKSESSWSVLSFCSAFRKTSCVLSAQVTPSCSANLDSSNHSSESKIHSASTPTPPSSPCTSLAHLMPSSEKVNSSSAASVTTNIQDTTCSSPDDYLSISQPSSQSPSLHDTSLGSDSASSNINNTPVTSYQPASTPLGDVVTVPKSSLHSSCSPDIITVCRTSSNSVSGNNPIDRVTSASDIRDVKYQVLSRPSSHDIPPAPPPTPLSHVTRKTISRSTISIHSHVVTPCSSALKASQPPCDGCFPDKAADHSSPDVRQFSSKTVILPKNVIRPSIPHIHSHILRPFSGCVSIKEDSRPLSGYSLRKGISETTFVIDSPKSAIRPCVSSRPSHRPNASSPRAGDAGRPPRGVRKLVSEATFVVNSPKVIARPTVSCDDSKVARRSVKFNPRVTLRAVSPGSPCRAFPKAASEAHSAVSVADLPSCARRALPARATATVSVPLRQATARPPPSRVKVLRPHSAEVKLGRRLLKAAQDGKAPAVQKLLDDGADVNFTFATKWTALHRAVKMGHEDVVCVLLAGGADLEAKTTYDFTALHIAAYYDLKGLCLARLIDAGCDLGSTNRSGKTPLHYASEVGNKMAVRALLVAGADTASLDDDGKTPFDVAKVGDVRGLLASAGNLGKAWLN